MRINIGCGPDPLPGYVNIDLFEPADQVGDFRQMSFQNADHIEMSHVLEHLSWREVSTALRIVISWLRPAGTIRIEVPDMTELCRMGTGVVTWELGLFGAQIHDGEYHKGGFSVESLTNHVARAGFQITGVHTFRSEKPERLNYPCIEITAMRPAVY